MTDWLLGTLLATSALIMLVMLAREPVRRRFGSRVTYGLWLIPVARLLMPTLTTTVERTVPAASAYRPIEAQMMLATVAEPTLADRLGGWPIVLLSVWLTVAVGLFISRLASFRRDRRAILEGGTEFARLGSVRVISSTEVTAPVAFGIIDRVIAVPVDFERLYRIRERRLALEHEVAHHKYGDLVANFFAFVLLCLQWFNPLAWVAHAAFRFDQEAACDARVLDNAKADDRADYGRAIAKAASGRALLFASALDRRNTLHRRLQSMLRSANPSQRLAGRLLVGVAIAVALPLTASRAIEYVDVAAPAPKTPPASATHPSAATRLAAIAQETAAPSLAPIAQETTSRPLDPVSPEAAAAAAGGEATGDLSFSGDRVTIDGRTKRWEELTPAEKNRMRAAVAKAREGLAKAHFDRDRAMREARAAVEQIDVAKLQREVAFARENAAKALHGLDGKSEELRRFGVDAEKLKVEIRRSMDAAASIDSEEIRRALAAAKSEKVAAAMAGAEAAMQKAQSELDRIDARLRQEQH